MYGLSTFGIGAWTVAATICVTTSCGPSQPAPSDLPPISNECQTPARVAVVLDQSTSMKMSGTAPVKAEELRTLIETLAECGGVLAIGFVREAPQPGLERIEFAPPPALPAAPVVQEDEQAYEFDDRVAAFNQLRVDRSDSIKGVLERRRPEIDGYLRRIDDLLVRRPAKGTDLNSALNAAELFLSEPVNDTGWQQVLILVSDGLDTGHKPRRQLTTGARVLWVNSTSDDKVLSGCGATRVEAFKAAVDDVINKLQTRETK